MQTKLDSEQYNTKVLDLIQNSHYQQAIIRCKRSLNLSKSTDKSALATQYYNWGYCCYRQGKYQEAVDVYVKGMEIFANEPLDLAQLLGDEELVKNPEQVFPILKEYFEDLLNMEGRLNE